MSRMTNIFSVNSVPTPTATNRDGYPSYKRPVEELYLQTLLTNTFGSTFYARQKDMVAEAKTIHDAMIAKDAKFACKAIIYARNHGFMRSQPLYGLAVIACKSPSNFTQELFNSVVLTPKDLADFFVVLKSIRGNEGGRKIKRIAGNWLASNLNEYWVIKYGAEKNNGSYSLSDLIRITHPNFNGGSSELFKYLLNKPVDLDDLPKINAFETLKKASSDEDKIACIKMGSLPHEVSTSFAGSSKKVWEAIAPNMPMFAMLRNLATLERQGALDSVRSKVEAMFSSSEAILKSKILPFRFMDAYEKTRTPWVADAVKIGLDNAFVNLPDIEGKTSVHLDISGSMSGSFLRIASVFAISLMRKTDLSGSFYLFDTIVERVIPSKVDSILSQACKIHTRGGTDTGAPLRKMLRDGEKVDNIIIITDEQQNTGGQFYTTLREYRRKINPNVKAFIIDVSPYGSSMVPKNDRNTYCIFGWSESVLEFISHASHGWNSIVEYINNQK